MKIEIDFEGMLKQAIANALAPEAIQPVIQQKMNEVVASTQKTGSTGLFWILSRGEVNGRRKPGRSTCQSGNS